jgi:cellulose synthase (UDP-forming)
VINNWSWSTPTLTLLKKGHFPQVAIIIPTWKEDPRIVEATILSVLNQDYPVEQMLIIVSDDSANPLIKHLVNNLSKQYKSANLVYHFPYRKGDERRAGEGKAGNLNSALELVRSEPSIRYIETRDADDLVGSRAFLKVAVGQLEGNEDLAYIQTVKDIIGSKGDPFGNREKLFYRSLMLSKNAANAVFPCGSGLVWRKEALLDIGGFPVWNLVEDFQSGAEALRRGWKAQFIPIVGAVGQVAPEDIPNMYKQRSTWAYDSLRFLLWGNKKGLNLRQRLHFAESGLFYIGAGIFFIQAFIPLIILFTGMRPIISSTLDYIVHLSPHILAVYLFVLSLMRKQGISFSDVMRSLQTAFGLGPVYIKAFFKTLWYGKNRKPAYVVTRKSVRGGLYLFHVREVFLLTGLLIGGVYFSIYTARTPIEADWGTILWTLLYIYIFSRTISNSFFRWTDLLFGRRNAVKTANLANYT